MNISGVFCEDPPVPDPQYDLSIVPNSAYYDEIFTKKFRIPLNGTVSYKCNPPGRFVTDYNVNTFDNVVTCVDLTDGSYNQFTWPTCKRSNFFNFYVFIARCKTLCTNQ